MLEVPFGPSLWTHLVALIPKPFVRRAVVPNSQNVVAIVCRDEQGVWRRVPSTKTKEGDEFRFLPTARGSSPSWGQFGMKTTQPFCDSSRVLRSNSEALAAAFHHSEVNTGFHGRLLMSQFDHSTRAHLPDL